MHRPDPLFQMRPQFMVRHFRQVFLQSPGHLRPRTDIQRPLDVVQDMRWRDQHKLVVIRRVLIDARSDSVREMLLFHVMRVMTRGIGMARC